MNRFLCIHLHFYQPPRENPWLDEIEYQQSAHPFHDWNQRISAECYRSNGASRILDGEGWVVDLANNYAKTSFNFGPTLLSWMEDKDHETYQRILTGDEESQSHFGGHGSAIAQCYNHIIMPLANRRDKETQVVWGLKDFEKRFHRSPEAMWLPETAVDIESLEVLSDHGMKYVILAPRQAKAVRKLHSEEAWKDVSGEKINPKESYLIHLPSGRSIAAFFYDGPISKAVAFEGLLHNGETFAKRLLSGFQEDKSHTNQLLHIATDGETYGHHHPQGDMALAYAISYLEKNKLATITNYGQFLELNPPKKEVKIHENSSWSCEHGIERWRSDCGCNSGGTPDWNQKWRQPLRAATNQLRDQLEKPFESAMRKYMEDPWAARNAYIEVINDRSLDNITHFLKTWCGSRELHDNEVTEILKALECQRHLLLMFTSCAWFFDDISGIETVQNLQYAYRALELAQASLGVDLIEPFLNEIDKAVSNIPEFGQGRQIFERFVKPAHVDNVRVGIHFAIDSVFTSFQKTNEIYNNKITLLEFNHLRSGKASLVHGCARVRSRVTLERNKIVFGVLHWGDHNLHAGVKAFENEEGFKAFTNEAESFFQKADFPKTMRTIDRSFGDSTYSLKDLFKDEQTRIINMITKEAMSATEERFKRLYETNYPLFCFMTDTHFPIPKVFRDITEFLENRGMRKSLMAESSVNIKNVQKYLAEAKSWDIKIDGPVLAHDMELVLDLKMHEASYNEPSKERLEEILELVKLSRQVPSPVQLGPVQNWIFMWYQEQRSLAPEVEEAARRLSQELQVRLPDHVHKEGTDVRTPVSVHVQAPG